jgi:hypothetical protein
MTSVRAPTLARDVAFAWTDLDAVACTRCRTTYPEAFAWPTAAYCHEYWAYLVDHGRRFSQRADKTIDHARGQRGVPFHVPRR